MKDKVDFLAAAKFLKFYTKIPYNLIEQNLESEIDSFIGICSWTFTSISQFDHNAG